jgi:hypothetical protein
LLLQAYEGVSEEEAKARADFDLRWKVALGIGLEERPFAKSTLQLFRARLILHERVRTVFGQRAWPSRAGRATSVLASSRSFWTPELRPGPGCGQGHVQPAGRRDHQAGTCISHRDPLQPGGVGAGARPGALLRLVS